MLTIVRFLAVMLTAISMSAGFAHLLALPNKIHLARDPYLAVQQIYRGWALLGIAVVGALVTTGIAAYLVRARRVQFYLTALALVCIALSLAVFFSFTFPANQATRNWTMLPENWEALRRQWEYSHAVGAGLYFVALGALTLSLLVGRG